jgi:hypothetical protein
VTWPSPAVAGAGNMVRPMPLPRSALFRHLGQTRHRSLQESHVTSGPTCADGLALHGATRRFARPCPPMLASLALRGQAMKFGVSPTTVGRLQAYGAPFALLEIVAFLVAVSGTPNRDLSLVELFAGQGEMSKQFQACGMRSVPYDVRNDDMTQDFTSTVGLLHAIYLVRRPRLWHQTVMAKAAAAFEQHPRLCRFCASVKEAFCGEECHAPPSHG